MSDAQTQLAEQQRFDEIAQLKRMVAEKDEAIKELMEMLDRVTFETARISQVMKPGAAKEYLTDVVCYSIDTLEKHNTKTGKGE